MSMFGLEGGGLRGGGVGGSYQPGVYVPLKALFLVILCKRRTACLMFIQAIILSPLCFGCDMICYIIMLSVFVRPLL